LLLIKYAQAIAEVAKYSHRLANERLSNLIFIRQQQQQQRRKWAVGGLAGVAVKVERQQFA